jgi:hypothetical protein
MKYKVGDKVRIKSLEWYNKNKGNADKTNSVWCEDDGAWFFYHMSQYCGKIMTITNVWAYSYTLEGSDSRWTDEMIDCLVERNGKTYPYKIGDRVILKGNNRCATITDLKYNSHGNLSYYIKIDNDKDVSVDYPTDLLLPYVDVVEDVDEEPQDKMVSFNEVIKWLQGNTVKNFDNKNLTMLFGSTIEMIEDFRKTMEG